MRIHPFLLPTLLLPLIASACATTARMPITEIPAGTYVMVEPEGGEYNAVTVDERAFSVRMGEEIHTGQHWVDAEGRIHMADDAGPCAGIESVWTYEYTGNRVVLTKVSDACAERNMPERMVYERS